MLIHRDLSDLTNKNVDLSNTNRDLTVDYSYSKYSYVNYQRVHIVFQYVQSLWSFVTDCYRKWHI